MKTIDTSVLGPDTLDAITALCRRSLTVELLGAELEGSLYAPDQPTIVRGDPDVGIVAAVPGSPDGFIRLLVVDPAHRGQGHGHTLLRAAEDDLADSRVITVGADGPYYLFAGVETSQTAMVCLLERHRYQREEANFDMEIDLAHLPDDPGGTALATTLDRDEVDDWMTRHWSNWRAEVLRALDKGTLLLARDAEGISAFCAWNVNRRGLVGPVASRPDLFGKGGGRAVLVGALHRIRASGERAIDVSWVGPIRPYAAVGGRITRVFFVYRKRKR
ncbi:MAG TPA: GNAT family N-acetyltransferase [Acidimicrobiia bacterium]|nr:GNAT family N-acetyltransferase [Acidimicrobiia bacterium]